jgi:hypothetical protein
MVEHLSGRKRKGEDFSNISQGLAASVKIKHAEGRTQCHHKLQQAASDGCQPKNAYDGFDDFNGRTVRSMC